MAVVLGIVINTSEIVQSSTVSYFSGYGKGGPCPSKDTWLLHIDRGHWERLGECPTTKTGASMVALPSFSTCAAIDPDNNKGSASINVGNEPAVAVLWSGLEKNPSSIRVNFSS